MKRFFYALFSVMLVLTGAVVAVSCGDDDGEEVQTQKGTVVVYIGTTDDMLGFSNISCEVKPESGQTISRTLKATDFSENSELYSQRVALKGSPVKKFYKLEIPASSLPYKFTTKATFDFNNTELTAEKYDIGFYFAASFLPEGSSLENFGKETTLSTKGIVKTVIPEALQLYSKKCTYTFQINKNGVVQIVG